MPSKKNRKSAPMAEVTEIPAEAGEIVATATPRGRGRPASQIPNALKFGEAVKAFLAGEAALPDGYSHQYPVVNPETHKLEAAEQFVTAPYWRVSANGQTAELVRLVKVVGNGGVKVETIKIVTAD